MDKCSKEKQCQSYRGMETDPKDKDPKRTCDCFYSRLREAAHVRTSPRGILPPVVRGKGL
jgi:hypothetical protein